MTAASAGARGYPKLLDQLRQAIRVRHYSRRTEEAYVWWVRRYIRFCGLRHPRELGHGDVTRFLSSLAIDRRVAASTQNQALSALVFLYQEVLELPVGWLEALVRAKRPARVPVVLTKEEVRLVLERVGGGARVGVAVGVPRIAGLCGPGHRPAAASSSPRDGGAAGVSGGGAGDGDGQAGELSHATPLVRDASVGSRVRHPHGTGAIGPSRRQDHDDIHPCPAAGRLWRPQPSGHPLTRQRSPHRLFTRSVVRVVTLDSRDVSGGIVDEDQSNYR